MGGFTLGKWSSISPALEIWGFMWGSGGGGSIPGVFVMCVFVCRWNEWDIESLTSPLPSDSKLNLRDLVGGTASYLSKPHQFLLAAVQLISNHIAFRQATNIIQKHIQSHTLVSMTSQEIQILSMYSILDCSSFEWQSIRFSRYIDRKQVRAGQRPAEGWDPGRWPLI